MVNNKMEIAVKTFGETVVVKQLVSSISESLQEELNKRSEGIRVTKKQIEREPILALSRKTVDTVDFIEALLRCRYLWGEMKFTDELRMCLVKMDIYSLNYLPDLLQDTKLREYVFSNSPRWLSHFGDLTEEEFIAFIKDNGCAMHVSNYKSLLLNNRELMDTLLIEDLELLSPFELSEEEEFSYLAKSPSPKKYKGDKYKVVGTYTLEPQHTTSLNPNTIYSGQVKMQADVNNQAAIYVEGDVFINPGCSENGVPICVDANVQKLTISSRGGARLVLTCPSYCIPVGVPTCTGLSYDRWSDYHGAFSLQTVELDNVQVIINSSTENLPLAGVYGEANNNIDIVLKNGASVNGDQDYSQEGYSVRLPYVVGSTKLSSEAQYTNTKKSKQDVEGF